MPKNPQNFVPGDASFNDTPNWTTADEIIQSISPTQQMSYVPFSGASVPVSGSTLYVQPTISAAPQIPSDISGGTFEAPWNKK